MESVSSASKVKATIIMIMISAIVFQCVSAANLTVGGSTGWDISSNIAQWSASTSFFVNDSLVFMYTPEHDLIEVNKADFTSCVISHPLATYDDGETVIFLNETGTRYFVCGRPHYCAMGLKLRVPVLDQPSPPGESPTPEITTSNSTTQNPGPAQAPQGPTAGGSNGSLSHDHRGSTPSNGCSSVGFITFRSFLLHLGIIILGVGETCGLIRCILTMGNCLWS